MAVSDVLVVGAGPAGVAAVLALLDKGRHVVWADPEFAAGRLTRLDGVPCNTKLDILMGQTVFGHPVMKRVAEAISPSLKEMQETAQELHLDEECKLGWTTLETCRKVYDAATAALLLEEHVWAMKGTVVELYHDSGTWCARMKTEDGEKLLSASHVVLATGSQPRQPKVAGAVTAEDVFHEESLRRSLSVGARVAVLGNSHSAAIVLASLEMLATELSLKVANFVKRPVRLAEWIPEKSTYRYTSTGLKGFGAAFGKAKMVKGAPWLEIKSINDFKPDDWDFVIDSTGYVPNSLPVNSLPGKMCLERNMRNGQLGSLPGLYAVGAPWGEPPGLLWGKGMEDEEGFKGEDSFIGFALFNARAQVIADSIASQAGNLAIMPDAGRLPSDVAAGYA